MLIGINVFFVPIYGYMACAWAGFAGYAVGFITNMILALIFGDSVIGTVALCLLVPSFVVTIYALIKKTHDTKGIDLDTVTGTEWD